MYFFSRTAMYLFPVWRIWQRFPIQYTGTVSRNPGESSSVLDEVKGGGVSSSIPNTSGITKVR